MESKQANRLPRCAPVTNTIPEEQTARCCRARAAFDQSLAPRRVANRSDSRCVGGAALSRAGGSRRHSPTGCHPASVAHFKPVGGAPSDGRSSPENGALDRLLGAQKRARRTQAKRTAPPEALWPMRVRGEVKRSAGSGWVGGGGGPWGAQSSRVQDVSEFYLLAWFKSSPHNVFLKFLAELRFFFLFRTHSMKDCICFQFLFVWHWIRLWCTDECQKNIKENKVKGLSRDWGGDLFFFEHNNIFLPGPDRILYPAARQDSDHLFVVTVAQLDMAFPPYYEKRESCTYLMSDGRTGPSSHKDKGFPLQKKSFTATTDEAPGGSTGPGVEPGILLKGIFSGFPHFPSLSLFFSSKTQDRKWRGEKK